MKQGRHRRRPPRFWPDTAPAAGEPAPTECCPCPVPTPAPPLDLAEAQQRAARLKALADPQRLRILSLLAAQPRQEPLCVCDIEAAFDLSQPTISHHLRVLRQAGLVDLTRRGLWHYYRLRPEGLAEIRDALAALLPGR